MVANETHPPGVVHRLVALKPFVDNRSAHRGTHSDFGGVQPLVLFVYQLLRFGRCTHSVLTLVSALSPWWRSTFWWHSALGLVRVSALGWIVPFGNQLAMSRGCQ